MRIVVAAARGTLHDPVLITAAFCMYNRCVDGLGTSPATDRSHSDQNGAEMAAIGYRRPEKKAAS